MSIWAYTHVHSSVRSVHRMSLCAWLLVFACALPHASVCDLVCYTCLHACKYFLCVQDFAWACVLLHVHQQGCLLSVCICWSVLFPLNHWWACNVNTGPLISFPTSCHQLASSQCHLQENQYAVVTKHRQQTCPGRWKKQPSVTKWTEDHRKKQVTVTCVFFLLMCMHIGFF